MGVHGYPLQIKNIDDSVDDSYGQLLLSLFGLSVSQSGEGATHWSCFTSLSRRPNLVVYFDTKEMETVAAV